MYQNIPRYPQDEEFDEVVLIGVDQTALQGMLHQPAGSQKGAVLLHARGGSRHDRAIKRLQIALEGEPLAILSPELVDESEGWHGFGTNAFFVARACAVVAWWQARAPYLQLSIVSMGSYEGLCEALAGQEGVACVVVPDGEDFAVCGRPHLRAADPVGLIGA